MTNIILPFHPGHIAGLKPIRQADIDGLGGVDVETLANNYYKAGPGYSYFVGHQIIAVIGLLPIWHGVGEVWMLTTEHVIDNVRFFHSSTLALMEKTRIELNLHRIQSTVHEGNTKAERWMNKLGFKLEGVHEMYGPDKSNHLRFARLWRD